MMHHGGVDPGYIVPLLERLKITNAIVLDVGGSSQLSYPGGSYASSRKMNNPVLLKEVENK